MTTENMIDSNERFRSLIEDSEVLKSRWYENSQYASARIKQVFGIEVTAADLAALTSLRVAVLSGQQIDDISLLEEAKNSEAAIKQRRSEEQKAAIVAGETAALSELDSMTRTEKMNFARANNLTGGTGSNVAGTSVADPDTLLRRCLQLTGQARINFARAHGLEGV